MNTPNSPAGASGTNDSYTLPRRHPEYRLWANGKMWSFDNKKWLVISKSGFVSFSDRPEGDLSEQSDNCSDLNAPLTEFTGLRDKNGVKVFEGDIVEYGFDTDEEKEIGVVKYGVHNYPAFEIYPVTIEDSNMLQFYHEEGEIEVVGNIFENPELLERV